MDNKQTTLLPHVRKMKIEYNNCNYSIAQTKQSCTEQRNSCKTTTNNALAAFLISVRNMKFILEI
jgi:hypothetical protein